MQQSTFAHASSNGTLAGPTTASSGLECECGHTLEAHAEVRRGSPVCSECSCACLEPVTVRSRRPFREVVFDPRDPTAHMRS